MKTEDLQAQGLNEDQIKYVFAENGKDIAAEKKRADTAEKDRDSWKNRAETAENTLKGFEGKDFDAIQKDRDEWKQKAETAEADYKQQIYDRDFSDALSTAMESYKFSSDYAKTAVMAEIKSAGLKLLDGKIIGLNDMIESIKAKDASAFVTESQEEKAKFTTPPGQKPKEGTKYTPEQLMKMKNQNPGLDISQYI
jgi:hypothetical protein|uniref:Minor structural protein n=1 Tax=Siphoviridae sp. ctLNL10 TaxID=2825453 RepID=A0A8S5Q3V6_9CAUD|nr:MAG TPA: minor structural protein [Siphoviridae sp. ctLNL10]